MASGEHAAVPAAHSSIAGPPPAPPSPPPVDDEALAVLVAVVVSWPPCPPVPEPPHAAVKARRPASAIVFMRGALVERKIQRKGVKTQRRKNARRSVDYLA